MQHDADGRADERGLHDDVGDADTAVGGDDPAQGPAEERVGRDGGHRAPALQASVWSSPAPQMPSRATLAA